MIVVMTTYEDGWCKKNLHTYTIDYGTIFELSEDSDSDSGNIIILGKHKIHLIIVLDFKL